MFYYLSFLTSIFNDKLKALGKAVFLYKAVQRQFDNRPPLFRITETSKCASLLLLGPKYPSPKQQFQFCFHDNMCDFYKSPGSFCLRDVTKPATFHLPVSLLFFSSVMRRLYSRHLFSRSSAVLYFTNYKYFIFSFSFT